MFYQSIVNNFVNLLRCWNWICRLLDNCALFVIFILQVAKEFIRELRGSSAKSSTKIIVSNHNWEFTPLQEEIDTTIEQMWATGGDIVKYVTTAEDITDVSRVFHFLSEAKVSPAPFSINAVLTSLPSCS